MQRSQVEDVKLIADEILEVEGLVIEVAEMKGNGAAMANFARQLDTEEAGGVGIGEKFLRANDGLDRRARDGQFFVRVGAFRSDSPTEHDGLEVIDAIYEE